ncbi:hypothetical protein N5A93_11760 [Roseovarius sp. EGI FJ00037]|uniref:hypothetical protein n=1 Tax=Roseovarius TaxID=74030 RepID=UPI0022A81A03|nr:hypothetical protein [Roseovarius sp. EGI FJ00037]MCZ0812909.1 hypothetical protein [Roseovarius sp. EGI FJ00037]
MTQPPDVLSDHCDEKLLGILARADAARLKPFAEPLIADPGVIEMREQARRWPVPRRRSMCSSII